LNANEASFGRGMGVSSPVTFDRTISLPVTTRATRSPPRLHQTAPVLTGDAVIADIKRRRDIERDLNHLRQEVPLLQYRLQRAQDVRRASVRDTVTESEQLNLILGSAMDPAHRALALEMAAARAELDRTMLVVNKAADQVVSALALELMRKEQRLEVLSREWSVLLGLGLAPKVD
jgi:hypothetical protein